MKGYILKKLVCHKAVLLTLIAILLAVPAIFLSGCSAGQVVAPFNPKEVKPEPYTPEPLWSERTDATIASIESMKKEAGQAVAPSAATAATSGPSVTTPGGTTPGGTTPGPAPGPTPTPGRVPLMTDPVYGVVRDRIEGGVIPGATVTLTERRGGTIATFTTTSTGEYSFVNIPVGYYNVTTTANGYSSCPLSTVDFNYFGVPVTANLELIYGMPHQIIEGGNFNSITGLGDIGYRISDGSVTDAPPQDFGQLTDVPPKITPEYDIESFYFGGQADGLKLPFYSAGTQVTYNAVEFNDIHNWGLLPGNIYTDPVATDANGFPLLQYQNNGEIYNINASMYDLSNYVAGTARKKDPNTGASEIPAGYLYFNQFEPWAEYDFTVPAPIANSYTFDNLWVTLPTTFKIDKKTGAWVAGGYARYWYYDWYDGEWVYSGNTKDQPNGDIAFVSVEPNTGQVAIRVAAYDENPYVITQVKLAYDYRKDTAAPTIYSQAAYPGWDNSHLPLGGSVYWIVTLQEEGFVSINVTGPSNFTSNYTYYAGDIGAIFGDPNLPAGNYTYTIRTSDLPGNTRTYGPYSFVLGPAGPPGP